MSLSNISEKAAAHLSLVIAFLESEGCGDKLRQAWSKKSPMFHKRFFTAVHNYGDFGDAPKQIHSFVGPLMDYLDNLMNGRPATYAFDRTSAANEATRLPDGYSSKAVRVATRDEVQDWIKTLSPSQIGAILEAAYAERGA